MEKKTLSHTMRMVAGIIYGLLCVYEIFSMRYIMARATLTDVVLSWLFEFVILFGAGFAAVYLLAGSGLVKESVRRAFVVSTVLAVIFELLTYSAQAAAINYSLLDVFGSMVEASTIWQLIGMVVRLLLMVLAAFFVLSASGQVDKELEEAEAEEEEDDAANEDSESGEAADDGAETNAGEIETEAADMDEQNPEEAEEDKN